MKLFDRENAKVEARVKIEVLIANPVMKAIFRTTTHVINLLVSALTLHLAICLNITQKCPPEIHVYDIVMIKQIPNVNFANTIENSFRFRHCSVLMNMFLYRLIHFDVIPQNKGNI